NADRPPRPRQSRADREHPESAGVGRSKPALPRTLEHVQELPHLLALLGGGAALDGVVDAVGDVVGQHLVLDALQRRADRLELGQHIDAVAVFVDHAGDAAHLALDAGQALAAGLLGRRLHGGLSWRTDLYIYPRGV